MERNIPRGYRQKFLNKLLSKIQQYIRKELYAIIKWDLFQGCKTRLTFEN